MGMSVWKCGRDIVCSGCRVTMGAHGGGDEVGAAVTAGEAFRDDLGGQTKIGSAAAAAEVGGVAAEVARGRVWRGGICGNGRGVADVGVRRVCTALSTPEGKRWEKVGWKDGRRGCSGEEGHCKK